MRNILAKDLKLKFIKNLSKIEGFKYEDGNPFLIKIEKKRFFIFIKNISPAYFKNSPDITRVQLPYSVHFDKIFKANIPFIILGYDVDNDTLVCWNPSNVKKRLNAKSNVSLYSRESLQSKVKPKEFKFGYLSNGEKIVIFKLGNLISFFENLPFLFIDKKESNGNKKVNVLFEPTTEYITKKLTVITDKSLIIKIRPLLIKNKVLEAVEVCTNFYKGEYKSMTFKDWFLLVKVFYKEISNGKT